MSMRSYPEYGFGIVLTGNDIDDFIMQQGYEEDDFYDFLESCEKKVHTVRYYPTEEFEGSSCHMMDGTSSEFEDMLVIWTLKQPDILTAVYSDVSEIENELREEFSFPEDFAWESHLGYFSGCIYC